MSDCNWCTMYSPGGAESAQRCLYNPFVNGTNDITMDAQDQLCQFTLSEEVGVNILNITYETGYAARVCPRPVVDIVMGNSAIPMCSSDEEQCLMQSDARQCTSSPSCSWCDFDRHCIPASVCKSATIHSVTPYYCPSQRCPAAGMDRCSLRTNATTCGAEMDCVWCANMTCIYSPAQLCNDRRSYFSSLHVHGEGLCPTIALPIQSTAADAECDVLQNTCLSTLLQRNCELQPSCRW